MDILRVVRSARVTARNHGAWPALYDLAMRAVNRGLYYKNLQCLVVDRVNPRSLELPAGFRFMRLDERVLLEFTKKPEYELGVEFVRDALSRGDECYGVLDGDQLANYGWYSRRPTLMDNGDLFFHFDPQFVYMYKGFTLEAYRGLRLDGISKTRTLAEFMARGLKGMVLYIELNNFNSFKSAYRMGARNCCRIRVVRLIGRYVVRAEPRCQYGLTFTSNSLSEGSLVA